MHWPVEVEFSLCATPGRKFAPAKGSWGGVGRVERGQIGVERRGGKAGGWTGPGKGLAPASGTGQILLPSQAAWHDTGLLRFAVAKLLVQM